MNKIGWIDNYKICNDGVCTQIDEYRGKGRSVRAAAEKMPGRCHGQLTPDQIRCRWKWHAQGQGGRVSPTLSDDEILAKDEEIKPER